MAAAHGAGIFCLAVWGKITLEPLDQESIKILANGKNPKKGFLIDYLRNFTRSAQEGLPIYRIDGGPGFIWAASFDQKGRGTLRLAAVQVSGFSPPPAPAPVVQTAAAQQEQLPPPAPVAVQTAAPPHQEQLPSETNQTIEKLQADLVISTNKISELERAKSDAEQAVEKAEQAKLNAENAKQEVEQARIAEKITSNALIAQLRADKAVAGTKTSRWEIALYGSVGGVLVILIWPAIGFLINRCTASVSKKPVEKPRTKPIEASAQPKQSRALLEPSTLSPGTVMSDAALRHDLEEEVATINAAQACSE